MLERWELPNQVGRFMLKQTFGLQRAWQRLAPLDDEACDEVHGSCQITKQWNFELVLIATHSKWCF
ncbi:Hypothetical protein PMT_2436 [Prochlorococcus marinus str. MIT 9313]|uniref:Uncharacterized protein n=1 Tax=Prochlorococcus marinus (strain MIT 9313) TaxID=74547 RepID=B9ERQ7_PROMM|nr:Hypothetical protein PMT_2436 [Prochlorococcus marinus str. MIT 9313]